MGYAELTDDNHAYNSAVLFGPSGIELNQRKRTLPGWNERGNLELTTIETEYGDIGMIICADSYSPDYTRILALNGADIILLPCTWWGDEGQLATWQTRARENGVWMVIGNRWGSEYDNYYGYEVNMNDAPSAIVSPYGELELVYSKDQDHDLTDKILLHTIKVDNEREVYSLTYRSPSSYMAIANDYYRPTLGNEAAPGLPDTDQYETVALCYSPVKNTIKNLNKIEAILNEESKEVDIVTLPAYGLTCYPIHVDESQENKDIQALQKIVDERNIQMLVTQINIKNENKIIKGMLILQEKEAPIIKGQIHDEVKYYKIFHGTHEEPFYIDLEGARVGIITGRDFMFPETVTSLAKVGTDIILISSDIIDHQESATSFNGVSLEYLISSAETLISHCVHIAVSDYSGYAEVIESEWGIKKNVDTVYEEQGAAYLTLDASLTRYKYLQEYLPIDIETLTRDGNTSPLYNNSSINKAA